MIEPLAEDPPLPMLSTTFFMTVLFFIGMAALTCIASSLRKLHKKGFNKVFSQSKLLKSYFVIQDCFNKADPFENLLLNNLCALNISRILFYFCAFSLLFTHHSLPQILESLLLFKPIELLRTCVYFFLLASLATIIADLFPRSWGLKIPEKALFITFPIAFPFLLLSLPLFAVLTSALKKFDIRHTLNPFSHEPLRLTKDDLIELIEESEDEVRLDEHQKKLIQAVFNFRDRVAREVMVPRVELFCLPADSPINEAALLLHQEGYSRIPVYKGSIDNIVGVLMYKDILTKYMHSEKENNPALLKAPIETIMKQVLYTPETKHISQLLQDFRKKQVHLAIVVDEYGGTEGIVTIEDILEEIVGEISDEYDNDPALFKSIGKSCWIVDARMNLLDVEEELAIKIPQEGDYDTIGGYIYQRLGTIPSKGAIIHHDDFILEILDSNDRSVETVKITKTRQSQEELTRPGKIQNPNKMTSHRQE